MFYFTYVEIVGRVIKVSENFQLRVQNLKRFYVNEIRQLLDIMMNRRICVRLSRYKYWASYHERIQGVNHCSRTNVLGSLKN